MTRRAVRVARYVVGLALVLPPLTATAQRTHRVTVTALDYAYQLPDTLLAGRTILGMVNRGAVRHELILSKLRPGATLATYLSRPRPERMAGGAPRLVAAREAVRSTGLSQPIWRADGRTLYFRAWMRETRSAAIAAVDFDGSNPRIVVRFDDPDLQTIRPEFSSDGKNFYFALGRSDGDLWVMELARK